MLLPRIQPLIIATTYGLLFWLENRRPLRASVEPKLRRNGRNLAIAVAGGAVMAALEAPIILPLCASSETSRWDIVHSIPLSPPVRTLAAILLLDYTLYLWHILTHKVPFLWRMHLAHHVDLDLDASTALRFHFTELAASIPYRAAQVLIIGVTPQAFFMWQTFLFVCILFHHSNIRLPLWLERRLKWIVVTPRLHGIHHSTVESETNSNWSSGLSIWDRLHGTFRDDVPQGDIAIGVPAYRDPAEVTLPKVLAMPFGSQRDAWQPAFPVRRGGDASR